MSLVTITNVIFTAIWALPRVDETILPCDWLVPTLNGGRLTVCACFPLIHGHPVNTGLGSLNLVVALQCPCSPPSTVLLLNTPSHHCNCGTCNEPHHPTLPHHQTSLHTWHAWCCYKPHKQWWQQCFPTGIPLPGLCTGLWLWHHPSPMLLACEGSPFPPTPWNLVGLDVECQPWTFGSTLDQIFSTCHQPWLSSGQDRRSMSLCNGSTFLRVDCLHRQCQPWWLHPPPPRPLCWSHRRRSSRWASGVFHWWEVGAFSCCHRLKFLTCPCSSKLCKQKSSPWQWNNPSSDEPKWCTPSTLWFGFGWICWHSHNPSPYKPSLPHCPFAQGWWTLISSWGAQPWQAWFAFSSCFAWPGVGLLHFENQLPSCPNPPWWLIRGFVPTASGTKPALANAGQPSETAAMSLFFLLVEAVVKEVMDSVGLDLGG